MISRGTVLTLVATAAVVTILAFVVGLSQAFAQTPPDPPSRFAGQVFIDGGAAQEGTAVAAVVNGEVCSTSTVFRAGGQSRYVINVPSGCGALGDTVSFTVAGRAAGESAPWANYQLGLVDLHASAGSTTFSAAPSTTPAPPATGDSEKGTADAKDDGGSGAVWLYAALGVAALAFGVGGATISRRGR